MDEAVATTYRCQHIGGPYDGLTEDREFKPEQQQFMWAQAVQVKQGTDAKPWLMHRYEIEIDGIRARLNYRGYRALSNNPLAKLGDTSS